MFGPEYTKIQTAFKRDERKVIIPGEWTLPEFAYLADKDWTWTEKVDGTNIRLHWNGSKLTIGGRTDNAQVPASLVAKLGPLSDPGIWREIFPDADDVTVYGEGYGAKIQSGGMYRPDQALIVFDVVVSEVCPLHRSVPSVTRSDPTTPRDSASPATGETSSSGSLSSPSASESSKLSSARAKPERKAPGLHGDDTTSSPSSASRKPSTTPSLSSNPDYAQSADSQSEGLAEGALRSSSQSITATAREMSGDCCASDAILPSIKPNPSPAGLRLHRCTCHNWWLTDESIADVAGKLGLDVVPQVGTFTLEQAWSEVAGGALTSAWENARIEGLVGRPAVPLFTRKGDRLIVKMKVKDWTDFQRRSR